MTYTQALGKLQAGAVLVIGRERCHIEHVTVARKVAERLLEQCEPAGRPNNFSKAYRLRHAA